MAKYSKKAGEKVEKVMKEKKAGTLKSGRSGKKVTSRKQAIAIGLSEARRPGLRFPKRLQKNLPQKEKQQNVNYFLYFFDPRPLQLPGIFFLTDRFQLK